MKQYLINFLKFVLFLGTGIVILYLVYRGQSAGYYEQECLPNGIPQEECSLFDKIIGDFKGVNYFWIFMVLVAFTISNLSRAVRWKMLMKPLGYRPKFSNCFLTIIIKYLVNLGLPRVGEVAQAGVLSQYEKLAPEKVMGTIILDRIFDVISLLIVIGLAFILQTDALFSYINEASAGAEEGATIAWYQSPFFWIIVGMSILAIIAWIYRVQLRASKIGKKVENLLKGFVEGLLTVRKLDRPWLFILHSINIWVMYFFMTYLCFFAYEPTEHLGPMAGLTAFAFGALGIVIPSPGGMGTYQYLVVQALSIYGIGSIAAFSFANICFFSIQLGCNVLLGLLAFAILPVINRNYHPEPVTDEPALQG